MADQIYPGQFIKVKVTGIQPYGAFVQTQQGKEGLIHISEIIDDFVDKIDNYLSVGQIIRVKVLSIDDTGKLNLTLKENNYFKKFERKKNYRRYTLIDKIKEQEIYGFKTLAERLPMWIEKAPK